MDSSASEPKSIEEFKKKYMFEQRREKSAKLIEKYPNRIPIFAERRGGTEMPELLSSHFLLNSDMTIGHFMFMLRKRIKLNQEQGIYVFVNNILPPTQSTLIKVYNEYKDADGYLYLNYSGESTFGY